MLLRSIRSLLLSVILTIMLSATVMFSTTFSSVQAATAASQVATQPQIQPQIVAMNRAEAVTKNLEGKAQEAIGNVTGDRQDQLMGKAKQAESQARHIVEDVKDQAQLKGRAKAVAKDIEGKAQEAIGNVTGDRQDQLVGRVKQAESRDRNIVEDVKDKLQDLFN
ncbi:MAG: CsbD family protein [Cyanobacteria bacterium J069]|nr:MAG: CsbD family protein [Cyanobacteria bacterium J069]